MIHNYNTDSNMTWNIDNNNENNNNIKINYNSPANMKCEKTLNFSTAVTSGEDDEYSSFNDRRKLSRDPMSHRIIEKRRRDRMNNCLADLSRLIPADYLKKGRGRIEKTEIIEMAIKYMKYLHGVVCSRNNSELPVDSNSSTQVKDNFEQEKKPKYNDSYHSKSPDVPSSDSDGTQKIEKDGILPPINLEHFKLGYQECLSESMHYLVEVKGYYPGSSLCVQLICHLQKHCDKILRGDRLNKPRTGDSTSTSSPGSNKLHGPGSGSSSSDSCERVLPKQEPTDAAYDTMPNSNNQQRENYCNNFNSNGDCSNNFSPNHDCTNHYNQNRDMYEASGRSHFELNQNKDNFDQNYEMNCLTHQTSQELVDIVGHQSGDNLTKPNLSLFNIEQENNSAGHCRLTGNQNSQHENIYPASPSNNSNETNSLYKFKNNIKQRFTAEHLTSPTLDSSSGYISGPPTKKSKSNDCSSKYCSSNSKIEPYYESNRSNDRLKRNFDSASNNSTETKNNKSIAIFALHNDGSFYVPLTIDYNILIPYLGNLNLKRICKKSFVLHPVTISVCFQQLSNNNTNNNNYLNNINKTTHCYNEENNNHSTTASSDSSRYSSLVKSRK